MAYTPTPPTSTAPAPRGGIATVITPEQQNYFRVTFSKVQSGVDTTAFTLIDTGSGQSVNQSAGNLVLTSGTTANSETIIRSISSFTGSMITKIQNILSQRIANNNFYLELVDVIGDSLTTTVNSATSITVTIPSNPFTSVNVGQSMYVGNVGNISATAVPGRYAIASVSGNNVNFTVAGWPATGSGTVSLFGWNYYQQQFTSTTATSVNYDSQRNGWNSGFTAATINTTASPGTMTIMGNTDGEAFFADSLVASAITMQTTLRASRLVNLAAETTPLFLQIRIVNGTTAPASTTTWTIGQVSIENFAPTQVSINEIKPQTINSSMPVQVLNSPAVTVSSGTITTVTSLTGSNFTLPSTTAIADIASAAITTTTTTATITPTTGTSYTVNIPVTVVTGTTPTMDVEIQESSDGGTNWYPVYDFPRIIAIGSYNSPVLLLKGNRLRYLQTIGGTTPSFTRAINRLQSSEQIPLYRQIIDRTIVLTTGGSSTVSMVSDGCRNVQMTLDIGAATTAPILQIQGSDDAGATWYSLGTALTGVASSTVSLTVPNVCTQFLRATVSTAGVGVTPNYCLLRAW